MIVAVGTKVISLRIAAHDHNFGPSNAILNLAMLGVYLCRSPAANYVEKPCS